MKDEKVWNQDLWKPLGIKEVEVKDYPCRNNGKLNSIISDLRVGFHRKSTNNAFLKAQGFKILVEKGIKKQ